MVLQILLLQGAHQTGSEVDVLMVRELLVHFDIFFISFFAVFFF